MKPSNILNAWIKADYDEIQPPTSTTGTKKPNLIVEVQNLLARAHTHSNNASVTSLFSQMRQMVTVYHGHMYVLVSTSSWANNPYFQNADLF